jgi:hypothetical protein
MSREIGGTTRGTTRFARTTELSAPPEQKALIFQRGQLPDGQPGQLAGYIYPGELSGRLGKGVSNPSGQLARTYGTAELSGRFPGCCDESPRGRAPSHQCRRGRAPARLRTSRFTQPSTI